MENYESLGTIGEGTYGVVLKCRHKITGQIVAIKKFKESDDDEQVKKTALREIKILKQLKHENIVSLLEVFRVKGKLYLVFEFVEKTILEEIEKNPEGLDPGNIKRLMWQLVRAIHFCHQHNIIHRDIKPENLLVSRNGVLKLCDFGFARPLAGAGAKYTEYVSTRWYRAPELLVGDVSYGKAVDVWSIGCMFAEITTGLPLFPGDSDIDQLYHIIRCLGRVTPRQQELFKKNSLYVGVKLPQATEIETLESRFPQFDKHAIDFLKQTIKEEPLDRWTCAELLNHPFFDNSNELFEQELQEAIQRDLNETMSLRKKRMRSQKAPPPSRGGIGLTGSFPTPLAMSPTHDEDNNMEPSSVRMVTTTTALTPKTSTTGTYKPSGGPKPPAMPMTTVAKDKPATKKLAQPVIPTTVVSPPHGGGNGIVLPTLSAMTPSSSSTSTASIDSTPPSMTWGGGGAVPMGATTKKTNNTVLPIPSEHMELIQQHAQSRVSMTSHGGRAQYAQQHPSPSPSPFSPSLPSSSFAPTQPKLPPTSYGRSPLSTHPHGGPARVFPVGAKPKVGHLHGTAATPSTTVSTLSASSLQHSMEIYSPKAKHGAASGFYSSSGGGPSGTGSSTSCSSSGSSSTSHCRSPSPGQPRQRQLDVAPSSPGVFVPPKTSHGGVRGKSRRDHEHRGY